jgi:C-terminal processing protease CtpA/Prc
LTRPANRITPPRQPLPADELSRQREQLAKVNFGFEKAERMRGNVGYLEIRGFVPPSLGAETATAAMSLVANSDALILDLRRNGGASRR